MTPTSTLQLACPTCASEIEIEYETDYEVYLDGVTRAVSLRTYCFHPVSKKDAYDLLMDYGARQAELATEGER